MIETFGNDTALLLVDVQVGMCVETTDMEFCTALSTTDAVGLLSESNPELERVQGNE